MANTAKAAEKAQDSGAPADHDAAAWDAWVEADTRAEAEEVT